ncbi:hypothetical protein ACMFMF_011940 [Clarireedia jacksonii]
MRRRERLVRRWRVVGRKLRGGGKWVRGVRTRIKCGYEVERRRTRERNGMKDKWKREINEKKKGVEVKRPRRYKMVMKDDDGENLRSREKHQKTVEEQRLKNRPYYPTVEHPSECASSCRMNRMTQKVGSQIGHEKAREAHKDGGIGDLGWQLRREENQLRSRKGKSREIKRRKSQESWIKLENETDRKIKRIVSFFRDDK